MHGQNGSKVIGYLLSSDGNHFGISEVYLSTYVSDSLKGIVNSFKNKLIGKDIDEILSDLENIRIPFASRNGVYKSIIGCIYNSIFDLKAKMLEVPLYKIINPNKRLDQFPKIYASGGTVVMTPEEIRAELILVAKQNYDGYKMRIGFNEISYEIERIHAMKGSSLDLMVDAIGGTRTPPYSTEDIISIYEMTKEIDLCWFEEPIDPDDLDGMNFLQNRLKVPFAGGEAYCGLG